MSHAYRKRNAQALYDTHYGPNMTPMVDVVMVILIFFMASTAFLGPEWFLRTYLPTKAVGAPSAEPSTRLQIALGVDDEGRTTATVNGGAAETLAELETRLAAEARRVGVDTIVVPIDADGTVPYEDVVRLHEICARLGITKVGLN